MTGTAYCSKTYSKVYREAASCFLFAILITNVVVKYMHKMLKNRSLFYET